MNDPYRDGWLIVAGLLYPVAGFGTLLFGGGAMGPLGFNPLVILLPALVLTATVVGLRLEGARPRWASVAAFVGWVVLVAFAQAAVYGAAAASV